jgi:hypothetical protein
VSCADTSRAGPPPPQEKYHCSGIPHAEPTPPRQRRRGQRGPWAQRRPPTWTLERIAKSAFQFIPQLPRDTVERPAGPSPPASTWTRGSPMIAPGNPKLSLLAVWESWGLARMVAMLTRLVARASLAALLDGHRYFERALSGSIEFADIQLDVPRTELTRRCAHRPDRRGRAVGTSRVPACTFRAASRRGVTPTQGRPEPRVGSAT